jgi:hypothetical protein
MTKNVGSVDRIFRIVLGLALIGWGLYAQNWWGAIGVIPLFTALAGWCPVYLPLRINTNK